MSDERKYDDIINLPHPVSKRHRPLGRDSYAAQFSPFAALTGYDGIVSEAARLTEARPELDEYDAEILSAKMRILRDSTAERPEVIVTFFETDEKKEGGAYRQKTARVKRLDEIGRILYFADGTCLPVDDITDLRGGVFALREREGQEENE